MERVDKEKRASLIHSAVTRVEHRVRFTTELVLMVEKMLVRMPEQRSSSLCWRRCRWMWWRMTGSRMLRDSAGRDGVGWGGSRGVGGQVSYLSSMVIFGHASM